MTSPILFRACLLKTTPNVPLERYSLSPARRLPINCSFGTTAYSLT